MNAPRRRLIRRLGALALLPLFGLVFWTAATIASSLPGLIVVAVNVHGLGLASYAGDSGQRPAPLSIQVLQDVQGDANGSRTAAPTAAPAPTPVAASHPPTPTPTPTPLPVPTLPIPTPTPTPAPATIGGQVLDSQTLRPIAAANVAVSPGGNSALTDVNGKFSIGVNAGSYTVTAGAPGYNKASQAVTVAAGQKATIGFRLVSVAAFGSLTGKVIDNATKAPIAGATVTLSDGSVRTTDFNGNFSFAIVLNGTYTVTVSALGYVTQTKSVTITPGHTTTVLFGLIRPGQRLGAA